jgi:hypothetical protein
LTPSVVARGTRRFSARSAVFCDYCCLARSERAETWCRRASVDGATAARRAIPHLGDGHPPRRSPIRGYRTAPGVRTVERRWHHRQGAVGEMAMSGWVNRVGPLAHRGRAVVSGPSPAGAAAGRPEFEACVEQHEHSRYRTGIVIDLTPVLDPPWDRRDRSRPSRWLRRSDWPDHRFVAVVGGAAGRAVGDRGRRPPSRRTPATGARAATAPITGPTR